LLGREHEGDISASKEVSDLGIEVWK